MWRMAVPAGHVRLCDTPHGTAAPVSTRLCARLPYRLAQLSTRLRTGICTRLTPLLLRSTQWLVLTVAVWWYQAPSTMRQHQRRMRLGARARYAATRSKLASPSLPSPLSCASGSLPFLEKKTKISVPGMRLLGATSRHSVTSHDEGAASRCGVLPCGTDVWYCRVIRRYRAAGKLVGTQRAHPRPRLAAHLLFPLSPQPRPLELPRDPPLSPYARATQSPGRMSAVSRIPSEESGYEVGGSRHSGEWAREIGCLLYTSDAADDM
eukprot:5902-Rhodomonas_salina.3